MRTAESGPLAPGATDVLPFVSALEREVHVEGERLFDLDSTDLTPAHWRAVGERVVARMDDWDGFVVVHGTDTMAWTASALSFALRGLTKPVVLTGAQRPIAFVRTDASDNLVNAAFCATMQLQEVGIFFGRWLFRGNRATKTSVQSYDAFESPELPPLLEMGVQVIQRTPARVPTEPFTPELTFAEDVSVVDILPGAHPRALEAVVAAGARGVILRAFGAGNVPLAGWPGAIRRVVDSGVPVAIRTQCLRGSVDLTAYVGGRAAMDAGAISTGAMTLEAATTKMMWLLGRGLTGEAFATEYRRDLAGEGA